MASVTRHHFSRGIASEDPRCALHRAICDLTEISDHVGLLATEDADRLDMTIICLRVQLEQTIGCLISAGQALDAERTAVTRSETTDRLIQEQKS